MSNVLPPAVGQRTLRVALIGECMIELQRRADGSLLQTFGGDTLNTAIYLARLGQRLPNGQALAVDYVTALGDDAFSEAMCAAWKQEQIGLSHVSRLAGLLPGLYCIQTDPDGERHFLYWRENSAARQMFTASGGDGLLAALADYDLIYLSGISLAILGVEGRARLLPALAAARQRGARVAFDNNFRPRLWPRLELAQEAHRQVLALVDLAMLSWDDDRALFGFDDPQALGAWYRQQGVGELLIKRGEQPSLLLANDESREIAGERVEAVVDTTAAGDSFNAAYLAARLGGLDGPMAARWGHRLAGRVIQYPGALIPHQAMPDMPR